jgi:hypothetical protein
MTAEEEGLNDSLGDDLDIESLFADLDKEEKDQEPVSETREQQDLGQSEEDLSQLEPTLEESAETGLEELDLELEISDTEEALGQETQPAAAREEAADEAVFQESRVEDDDLKDMDLGEDIQLGELEGLISDLDQDDGREPDEEMRAMLDADDQKTPEVSPEVLTKIKALEEKIKDLQTKMESAAALDAEEIVQMVDQRMQKAASAAPARQDEADLIEKIRDRVQTQVREGLDEWQAQKDELYADVKMLKEKFSELTALEEKIEAQRQARESAVDPAQLESELMIKIKAELERLVPETAARILREEIAGLKK